MTGVRIDRLDGKEVQVGTHCVSVIELIGKGGSAFVYFSTIDKPCDSIDSRCSSISWSSLDHSHGPVLPTHQFKSAGHFFRDEERSTRWKRSCRRGCIGSCDGNVLSRCQLRRKKVVATHSPQQKRVALKVTSLKTREQWARFHNEVSMLQKLSLHPNITTLIDSSVSMAGPMPPMTTSGLRQVSTDKNVCDQKVGFLLLEHCEGGSLMDFLLKQRARRHCHDNVSIGNRYLDLPIVLALFGQIADAVAYMHNRYITDNTKESLKSEKLHLPTENECKVHSPIIHRDIKPENILLCNIPKEGKKTMQSQPNDKRSELHSLEAEKWKCKLCDFGSAIEGKVPLGTATERKEAEEKIKHTTTLMYRAPEMVNLDLASIDGELTERTDIWALGCCLYTMCFLRNCFLGDLNTAIVSGKYTIPENHPYGNDIVELIGRMLVVDPSRRACINEVIECLEALKCGRELPPPRNTNRPKLSDVAKQRSCGASILKWRSSKSIRKTEMDVRPNNSHSPHSDSTLAPNESLPARPNKRKSVSFRKEVDDVDNESVSFKRETKDANERWFGSPSFYPAAERKMCPPAQSRPNVFDPVFQTARAQREVPTKTKIERTNALSLDLSILPSSFALWGDFALPPKEKNADRTHVPVQADCIEDRNGAYEYTHGPIKSASDYFSISFVVRNRHNFNGTGNTHESQCRMSKHKRCSLDSSTAFQMKTRLWYTTTGGNNDGVCMRSSLILQ